MNTVDAPIRYARAPDGVSVAYDVHGAGPFLIYVRGWVSHLEMIWDRPHARPWFEALAEHHSLVRYDPRGNGLSDRDAADLTLDALVSDLEAVVDALGIEQMVLYAVTFGGPIAMTYAARHPERVSRIILDGTYARGPEIASPQRLQTYVQMLRHAPEVGGMAMSRVTNPEYDGDLMRRSQTTWKGISPAVAATLYELGFTLDVTPVLDRITMPALVLHRRGSQAIPFELGRKLAAHLPDARFVPLDGDAHEPWDGDVHASLAAVADFLDLPLSIDEPRTQQASAVTILFTDLVDSTVLTQKLGDTRAQEIVRAHNVIVRQELRRHGGAEVKHTGDGIMASFASAASAAQAAIAMQGRVRAHSQQEPENAFSLKVGLNTGEPLQEEQDLFGTSVQLAARLCEHARPGEVLVASVVRDLCAGKGLTFEERGPLALKGFPTPIEAWSVVYQ